MTEITKKSDYKSLLDNVSTLIEEARKKAIKQVNTLIVHTYWAIGRLIVLLIPLKNSRQCLEISREGKYFRGLTIVN